MKKFKVLILGGNGFIGKNISHYLSFFEHIRVSSFDLKHSGKKSSVINYLEGDFFDSCVLKDIINGQDCIIHCVSTVNPGNSNQRYMEGYSRDFLQTIHLCNLIKDTCAKLIFLSSGGTVYGIQETQPISEIACTRPINHYGAVKVCIEAAIQAFEHQSTAKMLIARISNPYGPGQDYRKGVGFIDAAIKKGMNQEVLEIWGKGDIVRDYIYIEDVCKMIYALVQYEGLETIFNLSSGIGISQNQIVDIIKTSFPELSVAYKDYRNVDVKKMALDNSKIKSIYHSDIISPQEGIKKYIDYLSKKQIKNA